MAAVIPEARAARSEAWRLRSETMGLKLALRQSAAHSREQRQTAEAALVRVMERRNELLPSPWSALRWNCDDRPLSDVLVSLR